MGWVTHLERLLEAYGQVRESDPTEMRLLSGLGDAYRLLEKYHNARERYSSALDIPGQAHLELRADLVNKLGIVMREVGDLDQALEFFQRFLELSDDPMSTGAALNNIGLVRVDIGEFELAISALEQALKVNEDAGSPQAVSDTLGNLGYAHRQHGDLRQAIDFFDRSLQISRSLGSPGSDLKDLMNLGLAHSGIGDLPSALEYYFQALKVSRDAFDRIGEKRALIRAAECSVQMASQSRLSEKNPTEASVDESTDLDFDIVEADFSEDLTELPIQINVNRHIDDRAVNLYEQALEIAHEIKDDIDKYNILVALAELYLEYELPQSGIPKYEEAITKAKELEDRGREVICLSALIRYVRADPDSVARYKERAKLALRGLGTLRITTLNAWLSDDQGRNPRVLSRDIQYLLNLQLSTVPVSQPPVLAQSEIILNLVSPGEFTEGKDSGDGGHGGAKFTIPLPRQLRATDLGPPKQPRVAGLAEVKDGLDARDSIRSTEPAAATPVSVSAVRQRTGELSGTPLDGQELSEFSVILEGTGFDPPDEAILLAASWNGESDIVFSPITPSSSGTMWLDIRCEANGIPFDCTLPVNVTEEFADTDLPIRRDDRVPIPQNRFTGFELTQRGVDAFSQEQLQEALNSYQQALGIQREAGDQEAAGDTLNDIGHLLAISYDWLEGREDRAGGKDVWKRLVELDLGTEELLAIGHDWLEHREGLIGYLYVYHVIVDYGHCELTERATR